MPYIEDHDRYEAAIARRIKQNANTTRYRNWIAANDDVEEIRDFIDVKCYEARKKGFWHDMQEAIVKWGALTEGQTKAVRKIIADDAKRRAEWAARDAGSEYVGKAGERLDWDLTVNHVVSLEGQWGYTYINICKDADDNVIIYKGSKKWGKGEKISCVARIKEHKKYDGVKQTYITRPTMK